MSDLRALPTLDTVPAFAPLHAALVTLLRGLSADEWQHPTAAGAWRVRDVAAHLLDGDLRTLSAHRDAHRLAPDAAVTSHADVVALVQRLNRGGVEFAQRLSTAMLTDLLEVTGRWMTEFVVTLDPEAPALFAVSWAGETVSTNRFDTAREYTERWHHQMQVRESVGACDATGVLLAARFATPLFETAVRVLPHAYRDLQAPDGTAVSLSVDLTDDVTLAWTLRRAGAAWQLHAGHDANAAAAVQSHAGRLWRLFFNGIATADAPAQFETRGNAALLEPLWQARSVLV